MVITEVGESMAENFGWAHAEAWHAAYARIMPPEYLAGITPEVQTKQLLDKLAAGSTARHYMAREGSNVIGLVVLDKGRDADTHEDMEVAGFYLLPAYWGRGHGRQLMEKVISCAKARGKKRLVLWVVDKNERAKGFYEHLGFKPDGNERTIQRGVALLQRRYVLDL